MPENQFNTSSVDPQRRMTTHELNVALKALDDRSDDPIPVKGLEGTGKSIPYIGWFFRTVCEEDRQSFPIAHCGKWVGLCINNKWDYPSHLLDEVESHRAFELLEAIAAAPSLETCQAFFDYLQTFDTAKYFPWVPLQRVDK